MLFVEGDVLRVETGAHGGVDGLVDWEGGHFWGRWVPF